ncbi:MAG: chemotaxis response regulator protein-glutamate methylesterase [Phycisphaerales bacterium]|nr:chemotaxis response regulator protein-glutamate methylesterase [Phycisphaerales bacterium]
MAAIRVLVVDDSPFIRSILKSSLGASPEFEVVGEACDGVEAVAAIQRLRPDVVTLDVEMPNMNGLGVLERVAGKLPVSFLMVSTLTTRGSGITLEALRRGAIDFITKPDHGGACGIDFRRELHAKVKAACGAKGKVRAIVTGGQEQAPTLPPCHVRGWLVAIGISCGGPQTLHQVLPAFPSDFVPILVTQHMPAGFTKAFAANLDQACAMRVVEAEEGMKIQRGVIYIAPGSAHLKLRRTGVELRCHLDAGPRVSGHRPSADVMMASVAEQWGSRSVGVIMTGMGHDGAEGLGKMAAHGAWTIAQDEESSIVFGMPKVAIASGCVNEVLPMQRIPAAIAKCLGKPKPAGASSAAQT